MSSFQNKKYREAYCLRQVTPMICFHPDQEGATLRATEVKPQLDRFILKQEPNLNKAWRTGPKEESLKYKMFIRANEKSMKSHERDREISRVEKTTTPRFPNNINCPASYFGNMVNERDSEVKKWTIQRKYKEAIFFKNPLSLTISVKDPELLNVINRWIGPFFLTHNFGTRGNRGLGSFVLDGSSMQSDLETVKKLYPQFIYLEYNETIPLSAEAADSRLQTANTMMQLMKSGINQTSYIAKDSNSTKVKRVTAKSPSENYCKGFLIQYFLDKRIGSDKRFIKEKMDLKEPKGGRFDVNVWFSQKKPTEPVDEYRFVRALLGMPGFIQFRDNMREETVRISSKDQKVGRIPNPVRVKITQNYMFFLPQALPEELWKHPMFEFKAARQSEVLEIPEWKDFDVADFVVAFGQFYNDTLCNEIATFRGSQFKPAQNKRFHICDREKVTVHA